MMLHDVMYNTFKAQYEHWRGGMWSRDASIIIELLRTGYAHTLQ